MSHSAELSGARANAVRACARKRCASSESFQGSRTVQHYCDASYGSRERRSDRRPRGSRPDPRLDRPRAPPDAGVGGAGRDLLRLRPDRRQPARRQPDRAGDVAPLPGRRASSDRARRRCDRHGRGPERAVRGTQPARRRDARPQRRLASRSSWAGSSTSPTRHAVSSSTTGTGPNRSRSSSSSATSASTSP